MGSEPYWYYVKYQSDINAALQELRQQEFEAGRYHPVMPFPYEAFPLGPNSPAPGAQHSSIREAREDAAEEGTRSILDLSRISDYPDYGAVASLDDETLQRAFGTAMPTREMVNPDSEYMEFLDDIERGQGIYIVIYKNKQPDEIFFYGQSFD